MKEKEIVLMSPHVSGWYLNGIPRTKSKIGENTAVTDGEIPNQNKTYEEHRKIIEELTKSGIVNVLNFEFPDESLGLIKGKDIILSENSSVYRKYSKDNIVFVRDGFLSNQVDKILMSRFSHPERIFESEIIRELLLQLLKDNNIDREIIVAPDNKNLTYEGGDFRYLEKDNILFAGFNSNGVTSRNSKEGIDYVVKSFGITENNLLIVEPKGFHIDTVFSVYTNESGYLAGGLICCELVENYSEIKKFFDSRGLSLINVSKEYGVKHPKMNPNGNGGINTLQVNEYLFSNLRFPEFVEEELLKVGIKRVITPTNEFWKAGGGIHCLTNQI